MPHLFRSLDQSLHRDPQPTVRSWLLICSSEIIISYHIISYLYTNVNSQFKISLIRNNLKYNKLENEENDEDIIIGYSLIKYFNFTIFSYENRSVSFVSDLFIMDDIPKFPNKLIRILLSFLVCILFISIPFLIYIKLKTKYYLSNEFYSNMLL